MSGRLKSEAESALRGLLSQRIAIIDGAMGSSFLHRLVEVLESTDPNEEL